MKWVRKPCQRCGGKKPPGRRRHVCDKCQKLTGPEKARRWKANITPTDRVFLSARSSAGQKGLAFDLTRGDCTIPKVCPILGIPLFFTPGKRTRNTPTIDRIYCNRGHEKENVVIISWRANDLKKDATIQELQQLAHFYKDYV